MATTILMPVIFLVSVMTGFCMKQAGSCRPVCSGSDCITVNQEKVDFKTAEESCRERNGQLMTLQPETNESILNNLSQELHGNFWIGLRLPAGACNNLSAPLRGYEWTSGSTSRSFMPSFSGWKDSVQVCSPRCVSLSNDQKWTERLCSDQTDGYLCTTKHNYACQAQELSDPIFFKSSSGCSTGPCEHDCKDVEGGYECHCFKGYTADSKDPVKCILHCDKLACPRVCEGTDDSVCFCPSGYLLNDSMCEDIDECAAGQCSHGCNNTLGSFVCSCPDGYVLKDQVKCIKVEKSEIFFITTPITEAPFEPTTGNKTRRVSSGAAGSSIWVWIFVAFAVVAVIIGVRFYVVKRQKRREQNSNQQATIAAPMDNKC